MKFIVFYRWPNRAFYGNIIKKKILTLTMQCNSPITYQLHQCSRWYIYIYIYLFSYIHNIYELTVIGMLLERQHNFTEVSWFGPICSVSSKDVPVYMIKPLILFGHHIVHRHWRDYCSAQWTKWYLLIIVLNVVFD